MEVDYFIQSIIDMGYDTLVVHTTIVDSVTIPFLSFLLASSPQPTNGQKIHSSLQGKELINILTQTPHPILSYPTHFFPNHTITHTTENLQWEISPQSHSKESVTNGKLLQAKYLSPTTMAPNNLHNWSSSQLFTFIQLVSRQEEALHNTWTTKHEKQQQ